MNWGALPPAQSLTAISPSLGVHDEVGPLRGSDQAAAPAGVPFGQLIADGIQGMNDQLIASQVDLQRLATGDAESLHRVMMNLDETRLNFQLLLQVRNRLLEAYQDVMKMQV